MIEKNSKMDFWLFIVCLHYYLEREINILQKYVKKLEKH